MTLENFLNFTFSRNFFRFSSAKNSDDFFLVIFQKHRISPCFSYFFTFPPCFAKILLSPYFDKFSPCFRKIHLLFTAHRQNSPRQNSPVKTARQNSPTKRVSRQLVYRHFLMKMMRV